MKVKVKCPHHLLMVQLCICTHKFLLQSLTSQAGGEKAEDRISNISSLFWLWEDKRSKI